MLMNEILFNKDECLRHEALEMAVSSSEVDTPAEKIVQNASEFENYIKNGLESKNIPGEQPSPTPS